MSRKVQRVCPTCHKQFEAYVDRKRFCCNACYLASKTGSYIPASSRKPPQPVHIRLPKPLPVFPEFQLTPGAIYPAVKYQNLQPGRATYVVTLDEDHRTIVRQDECEEVAHE